MWLVTDHVVYDSGNLSGYLVNLKIPVTINTSKLREHIVQHGIELTYGHVPHCNF